MKRLLLALPPALLVCGALAAPQAIDLSIAAGKVGEVCMKLRAGDTLAWDFEASAAADFNLHHHVGKEVRMPVERKAATSDRARHTADRANDWCLMWTAPPAQPVTVRGTWHVVPQR